MKLSIVIPCLNEENTIEICIKKAIKSMENISNEIEIIVSDNGSTDLSVEIAEKTGNGIVKVVHCNEKGYGNALLKGISIAEGEYVLFADADNTYDFLDCNKFLEAAIKNNADLVIGSRFKGRIEKGAMPFLHKYLGNPFLTFLINILFKGSISDSQCGMRLFKTEAFRNVKFSAKGMEFATEIVIEFLLHNFKIIEIPITLSKGIKGRKPHLRTFRDGFKILFFMLEKKYKNSVI